MEINESKVFNFSHPHNGITYQFSIPAANREEASKRLIEALEAVIVALQAIKAATRSN